jgi:hypothetical protein
MRLASIAIIALATLLTTQTGAPCATVYGKNPVALIDEKVIIVWDEDSQTQHFVRKATFKGEEEDFGFIVPTPSEPQVVDVSDSAFPLLEYEFAPRGSVKPPFGGGGFGGSPSGVKVLQVKQVGDYKATVLKATDGAAMLGWLKDNDFDARPGLKDWLDYYAKQDWVFTALKYDRPKDSNESQTTALRLSFKTVQPVYPYRMPADSWRAVERQPMAIYFVATDRAQGQFAGGKGRWNSELVGQGYLRTGTARALATYLKLSASDMPDNPYLTALKHLRTGTNWPDVVFTVTKAPSSPRQWQGLAGLRAAWTVTENTGRP